MPNGYSNCLTVFLNCFMSTYVKNKVLLASEWNIVSFQSQIIPSKKHISMIPTWSYKCLWLYILWNNIFI